MTEKIVASLFESAEGARVVADALEAAGIDRSDVSLFSDAAPRRWDWGEAADADFAAPILPGVPVYPAVPVRDRAEPALDVPGTDAGYGRTSAEADRAVAEGVQDLADWLSSEGVDDNDAHAYAEGVRQGGTLLVVKCDDANVSGVVAIIDSGHREESDRRSRIHERTAGKAARAP